MIGCLCKKFYFIRAFFFQYNLGSLKKKKFNLGVLKVNSTAIGVNPNGFRQVLCTMKGIGIFKFCPREGLS